MAGFCRAARWPLPAVPGWPPRDMCMCVSTSMLSLRHPCKAGGSSSSQRAPDPRSRPYLRHAKHLPPCERGRRRRQLRAVEPEPCARPRVQRVAGQRHEGGARRGPRDVQIGAIGQRAIRRGYRIVGVEDADGLVGARAKARHAVRRRGPREPRERARGERVEQREADARALVLGRSVGGVLVGARARDEGADRDADKMQPPQPWQP